MTYMKINPRPLKLNGFWKPSFRASPLTLGKTKAATLIRAEMLEGGGVKTIAALGLPIKSVKDFNALRSGDTCSEPPVFINKEV